MLGLNLATRTSFATILPLDPGDTINAATLRLQIAQIAEVDDVSHERFLEGLIFQGGAQDEVELEVKLSDFPPEWGLKLTCIATGSVRIPALRNGCFGLQPSTGLAPTEGVVSVYLGSDTPGLLGSDLSRFEQFVWNWYGESIDHRPITSPKIVIPTDFFGDITGVQRKVIELFVVDLKETLATKAERRSLSETWKDTAQDESTIARLSSRRRTGEYGI
ncbi:hypothetical protein BU23DRAFT_548883 [Bimuria novae-zelandiae CBS 107.79]|uniref:Amidase domain-containing protein n=1 Tax=Bimuria novae-zelandiae CBS 107.79 TaxID=1447943 RepID=A0A6A5W2J1_9PLEO|nr:hypothetical protein BU23DRAFT_548883 [Bimuria novae-zelandiae CBS 107.79]